MSFLTTTSILTAGQVGSNAALADVADTSLALDDGNALEAASVESAGSLRMGEDAYYDWGERGDQALRDLVSLNARDPAFKAGTDFFKKYLLPAVARHLEGVEPWRLEVACWLKGPEFFFAWFLRRVDYDIYDQCWRVDAKKVEETRQEVLKRLIRMERAYGGSLTPQLPKEEGEVPIVCGEIISPALTERHDFLVGQLIVFSAMLAAMEAR